MKKLVSYIILILIVVLGSISTSRAINCITPNTTWKSYIEIVKKPSELSDGVNNIDLFGDYKRADPVLGNIFVMKYMRMGIFYFEPEELMPLMLQDIIKNSPKIFNITDPTSPYNIRIDYPACWTEARDLFGGPLGGFSYVGGWKACQNSGCCSVILILQKVGGKIIIRSKVVSSATDCSGGIASENTPCHYVCNFIDDLPVDPSAPPDPPHGPCFNDCAGKVTVPNFLPSGGISYDLNGTIIKIAPKVEISKCPDGTINIALQGIDAVPPSDLTAITSNKLLIKFVMEYLLKYFTENNLTQKVKFSVPCFVKSPVALTPCVPNNCCDILFDLYRIGASTYIDKMASSCGLNPDIPTEGTDEDDLPINVPILPNDHQGGECDLKCYWRIDGNDNIDDAHNFIGPTNGKDFIIKTGNGPLNLERMRVTAAGEVKVAGMIKNTTAGQPVNFEKIFIGTGTPNPAFNLQVGGDVKVGGTTDIGENLKVHGKIYTTEVFAKDPTTWPDYVFAKGYKLTSLSDVSDYISKYNHLPEIPSKEDISKDGVKLVEMQTLLLKKIEEITLHLIDQEKVMIDLKRENGILKKEVSKLKKSK